MFNGTGALNQSLIAFHVIVSSNMHNPSAWCSQVHTRWLPAGLGQAWQRCSQLQQATRSHPQQWPACSCAGQHSSAEPCTRSNAGTGTEPLGKLHLSSSGSGQQQQHVHLALSSDWEWQCAGSCCKGVGFRTRHRAGWTSSGRGSGGCCVHTGEWPEAVARWRASRRAGCSGSHEEAVCGAVGPTLGTVWDMPI